MFQKNVLMTLWGIVEEIINELHPDTIKSLQAKRNRNVKVADDNVSFLSTPKNVNDKKGNKLDGAIATSLNADNKLKKTRKAITKWALKHPEVPSKAKYNMYEDPYIELKNEPRYSNEKPDSKTLVYKNK